MQAFFLVALPLLAHMRVSYGNPVCAGWTQILLCRKWAPARILHKGFQAAVSQLELISDIAAVSQLELISDICAFTTRGQCEHFSQQHSHCRPTRESYMAASCMLDGPMQGNCMDTIVQEVGPCKDLMQGVGQLKLISNTFSFTLQANMSTLPE